MHAIETDDGLTRRKGILISIENLDSPLFFIIFQRWKYRWVTKGVDEFVLTGIR